LSENEITKISGLDNLINLVTLNLHDNKIKEISGLNNLRTLISLDLNFNQISELKGLEHLSNLRSVELEENNIPIEVIKQIGVKHPYSDSEDEYLMDTKKVVEYCRKNARKFPEN